MIDNSQIILKQHDTGVAFDFPLATPTREVGRKRAWRLFEVGIVLLMGSVIGLAVLHNYWRFAPDEIFALPFLAGLVCLILAASQGVSAMQDDRSDDDLRQLSVAGHLLIRTGRNQHKRVWYRDEIAAIIVAANASKGLDLIVELYRGERVILGTNALALPAELESIATELWRALQPTVDPLAHAIEAAIPRTPETRIAEGDSLAG